MDIQDFINKTVKVFTLLIKLAYWYVEALFRQFVPPDMKCIDGETILVTGAVGGIGKEICKHLVRSGTNLKLILWDLNQTELDKFAEELRELIGGHSPIQVYPMAVDISTRENIDVNAEEVKRVVGPVSVIFNNAGILPTANFLQMQNNTIDQVFQINLMSQIWIIRQFLPDMAAKNHGRIVNICSTGGLKSSLFSFPYFSSKFAVNGYTEALKMELAFLKYDGIHVTTVYPHYVKTPLVNTFDIDENSSIPFLGFFQKFLKPEHVAMKTVDGMRREYEYVYCPSALVLIIPFSEYVFPLKFRKLLDASHAKSYSFQSDGDKQVEKYCMSYNVSSMKKIAPGSV